MNELSESLAPFETLEVLPPRKVLFREGAHPERVYYLHSGEVDLSFAPKSGEPLSLLCASAGQILGLSCIVTGKPHDCTAITRTHCITGFVEKDLFLRLLDERPDLWITVLRMISSNINACWDCMRSLAGVR